MGSLPEGKVLGLLGLHVQQYSVVVSIRLDVGAPMALP